MSDAPKTHASQHPNLDRRDDMHDDDVDLKRPGKLAGALRAWSEMAHAYWDENHHAIRVQKWHRRIVMIAVWTGTIAVILAVVQLLFHDQEILLASSGGWVKNHTEHITIAEFLAAMAAAGTVLWGLLSKMQKEWLLKRHRAERMRMLKYRSLLQYAAAGMSDKSMEKLIAGCRDELNRIEAMDEGKMEAWLSVNHTWEDDPEQEGHALSHEEMTDFLAYYRRKRLDAQTEYFDKKANQAQHRDSITGLIPPLLFVASILCAATHFGIDAIEKVRAAHAARAQTAISREGDTNREESSSPPGTIALLLVAGAACFPILGSAIRTYRSANEFSRNSKRFRATHTDLHRIGGRVEGKNKETQYVLEELWRAEESLEREHREWLRLMVEAEWYA